MFRIDKIIYVLAAVSATLFTGCKKWDTQTEITNTANSEDLMTVISKTEGLLKFREYLVKTGMDKVLSSSKTYTVWAPTDAALQHLDPAISGDTARLRMFLANHISNQTYRSGDGARRIQMLSGKYHTFENKQLAEAKLTGTDQFAKNGVLHEIDKPLPVLMNLWEFLNSSGSSRQKAFLQALDYAGFDPGQAEQVGVDPSTGNPVYKPGTGITSRNQFLDRVQNLKDEGKQYTFFVLHDTAFVREHEKLKRYFATGSTDSTDSLASWQLVRDLAVEGVYEKNTLPDTLLSRFGVKVPVDRSAIISSHKTSNGIVHVMSRMNFRLEDKLPSIVIQGESPRAFSHDRRANTFYRVRNHPVTGLPFFDILVQNHATALFHINYQANRVYSTRYKAYWVAVNDFMATTHQQRLVLNNPSATTLPYTTVPVGNYREVLLGEFTLSNYQSVLDLYLVSANSTNNSLNPLVLDYIRLEPVF